MQLYMQGFAKLLVCIFHEGGPRRNKKEISLHCPHGVHLLRGRHAWPLAVSCLYLLSRKMLIGVLAGTLLSRSIVLLRGTKLFSAV